jgi:hypothetical protein
MSATIDILVELHRHGVTVIPVGQRRLPLVLTGSRPPHEIRCLIDCFAH